MGEPEKGVTRQWTIVKPLLLHALQRIHQSLMKQADDISLVKGMDVASLSVVLPIPRSVTGTASTMLSRVAERLKEPKEPVVPTAPVTVELQLWLTVMSGTSGCNLETPLPTGN